jgi:uncharacterized protein YggE
MVLRILGVAAVAAVLVSLAAAAEPDSAHGLAAQLRAEGITVSGSGIVRTTPDRAEVSFGVQSQARTASAALTASNTEIEKVIAALRASGVAAADIQTQQVSLSPRYTENGQDIVGYTAQNSVSAKLRNLERAGAVIDAGVAAGANQLYGPSLSRSDADQLYRNALRAAVADAREKAQVIATAAGVSLGKVLGVEESGATPVAKEDSARSTPSASIEPGTQDVQAMVVVTFVVP